MSRHEAVQMAEKYLAFVDFPLSLDTCAYELNTIQLKKLELARVLSTECNLLLLDEVAAGLTSGELDDIANLIRKMRDSMSITIIIVEHLMKLIMGVCNRIAVLYYGEKLAEGTPAEITAHPEVIKAYLGEN